MRAITLRGIDDSTYKAIKEFSSKSHTSMNKFILNIVRGAVGMTAKSGNHDFDEFFGTWSKEEYVEFKKNIKCFDKVDKEFWQ